MHTTLLARLSIASVVFVGLLTAFPDQPWHWDEFQLAYAVRDFDLARHQPHPPGYYLFVVAGRAFDTLLGDPFLALRCVSALAVAAFAGMALGAPAPGAAPRARGLWLAVAAVFALASPLTQRFGVAGLTYAAEGALWLAWLLALSGAPHARGRLLLAAAAGLAGGVRPTLILWAALMLGFDVVRRREWRSLPGLALAGAAGVALWAIPMLWEAGGWSAYRADTAGLAAGNVWAKSVFVAGFAGWGQRLAAMGLDLATSLGAFSLVVAAALVWRARGANPKERTPDALLMGSALAFSFYALVIYDSPGYLLAVGLPLTAWALRSVASLAASWPAASEFAAAGVALSLAGLTALTPRERIDVHYSEHAQLLEARFSPVRENFEPQTTLLITSREYWDYSLRHVAHAMPEFRVLQLMRDPYVAIVDDARPYLLAWQGELSATGPESLDLAQLGDNAAIDTVVYMVPFDADEFVAKSCGELGAELETPSGEALPVLRTRPGWRIEARGQRLHCVRVLAH